LTPFPIAPILPHVLTSTAYFPPLSWLVRAARDGEWILEAHENYQKGGWRNRCRILTANGPLLLSVPLQGGKHRQQSIREVRIDHTTDWQRRHAQTIRSAYGRAPFFEHYAAEILQAAVQRETFLWEYNLRLLRTCIDLLEPGVIIRETAKFSGAGAGAVSVDGPTPYPQVFGDRFGFTGGLSLLDGLFCGGPGILSMGDQENEA
jgi:hypothetical protein